MIVAPGTRPHVQTNGTAPLGRRRPPPWRRGRVVLGAALVVLLMAAVAVKVLIVELAPPPSTAAPVVAPLVAHGQIMPARQAHVGTQGGGIVQQLDVSPGQQVTAQTPLAWVVSPAGTEVVTAPFAGTVTNVLAHSGDTLVVGAPIAVVADLNVLQVETSDVDEFLVSKVSVGQRVQLNVDALDSLVLTGIVSNVALLPQSGAGGTSDYPVIVSLGGLPSQVRAGMSVRVTFPEDK
jgi:multidrug efflux pump subunit AcrA (membrane-fusion protein)